MKTKLLMLAICLVLSQNTLAAPNSSLEPNCDVRLCNKIERVSLDIWAHVSDSLGETCFVAILPKSEARVGHILNSSSRWYQGRSINITKNSVTRVAQVIKCY